jgi:alpha/beta superfamily hydrolase
MKPIEPCYFGDPDKPLLGCYHAPESDADRDCAVVLCYPMGHEYIQFHRACRLLAASLALNGFPTLRFDFYGCGDSSGNDEDGRIQQWLTDISSAIKHIKNQCRARKICLVGLRLGGTLSMIAGAQRGDIDGLALWDPVVQGKSYIAELQTLHNEMLARAHLIPKANERQTEILGYLLTDDLRLELENIDLQVVKEKPANNMLVIESHKTGNQQQLSIRLKNLHANVKYLNLPHPQFWTWMEDFSHIVVPQAVHHAIVDWMSEVYP